MDWSGFCEIKSYPFLPSSFLLESLLFFVHPSTHLFRCGLVHGRPAEMLEGGLGWWSGWVRRGVYAPFGRENIQLCPGLAALQCDSAGVSILSTSIQISFHMYIICRISVDKSLLSSYSCDLDGCSILTCILWSKLLTFPFLVVRVGETLCCMSHNHKQFSSRFLPAAE